MNDEISALFADGLKQLNLSLDPALQQKLLQFLAFLQKWSRSYNLTAITQLSKMVSHHLLDSLAIAPFITGENILDVGSGAGFPGIPLAIYFPQKQWILLDSNGKKTRFLIQAKAELQLTNIEIVQARMEKWQPTHLFDAITVRAVGDIKTIIAQTRQHLAPKGRWFFMKGDYAPEELAGLTAVTVHPLTVPGVSIPRYLIIVSSQ